MPTIPAPHHAAPARPASPDHVEDRAAAQVRRLQGELAAQSHSIVLAHADAMERPAQQHGRCLLPATASVEEGIRAIVRERAQLHYFAQITLLALSQFDRLETLTTNVLESLLGPQRPLPAAAPPQGLGVGLLPARPVPGLLLSTRSADRQRSRLAGFYSRMQQEAASVEADFRGIAERLGTLRQRPAGTHSLASVAEAIDGVDEGRRHVAQLAEGHRLAACRLSQLETDAHRLVCEERAVLRAYGERPGASDGR